MMERFLHWLADNWAGVALAASMFIQISPMKWNPWSSLFKWAGKLVTAELTKKVEALEATTSALKRDVDENEKDRIRHEVLSFANECRRHIDHTKDEFDHIISLNEKYEQILKRTNDQNGVFTAEYRYIFDIYQECLRENKFL